MRVGMRRFRRRKVCEGLDKPDRIKKRVFRHKLEDVRLEGRNDQTKLTWPMACNRLRTVRIILNKAATTVGSATLSMGCGYFSLWITTTSSGRLTSTSTHGSPISVIQRCIPSHVISQSSPFFSSRPISNIPQTASAACMSLTSSNTVALNSADERTTALSGMWYADMKRSFVVSLDRYIR